VQSHDLFGDNDLGPSQQAALNLCDSFVELESRQYIAPSNNTSNNNNANSSNANQQLKASYINDDQNRQMKA
jgi:hypothetical protein